MPVNVSYQNYADAMDAYERANDLLADVCGDQDMEDWELTVEMALVAVALAHRTMEARHNDYINACMEAC